MTDNGEAKHVAHETPKVTVDIIIELLAQPGKIVLITRKNPPLGYALPGGFVDIGEKTFEWPCTAPPY